MRKAVLVTNIPSPYRIPLFNAIAGQLRQDNIELTVIFGRKTYERRKFDQVSESEFEFQYRFLDSETIDFGNQEKTYFSYKGLFAELRKIQPDCIIMNGYTVATTILWLRSFLSNVPFIVWSGSIFKSGRFDSLIRRIQRKLIIRRASAFIAYGSLAKEYLIEMGASEDEVFVGINTVDTRFFKEKTTMLKRDIVKEENKFSLTYIGYLSARKNVIAVLNVMKELVKHRKDFVLDILGDGPELENLKNFVLLNKLSNHVKFHGFIQKKEIPIFLAKSDCFLFQTDFDIWGLVLNEAMASGCLVISSENAGATKDLIQHGVNGYIADYREPVAVAKILDDILCDPKSSEAIRRAAMEFIETKASVEISAAGFTGAITYALGQNK